MNGITQGPGDVAEYWRGSWQDGDSLKGLNVDFTKPVQHGPEDHGFDTTFYTAACSTIDGPFAYINNRYTVGLPDRMIEVDRSKGGDYRPRPGWQAPGFDIENVDIEFTKKAIRFMDGAVKSGNSKPFFLYLALSAPHAPWLPPEMVQGRSQSGPRGDQVVLVDWCVGEIMSFLKENNIEENTLLIFTSDNGPRHGMNGQQSAGKLRGYKSHIWEGGHRIPFIVRWPAVAPQGEETDKLICLTDMMATFAAITGSELPGGGGEDSYSILPALNGEISDKPVREAIVHHSENGTFSIRNKEWKLVLDNKSSGGWVKPSGKPPVPGTPGQLYNLNTDPYEQNDLWEERPEIVNNLTTLLERYKTEGRSNY